MGLLWGAVLAVLFGSSTLTVLINLPLLILQRWISNIVLYFNWWLGVIFAILSFAFIESVRSIVKYTALIEQLETKPDIQGQNLLLKNQLSLFRSQRNAYLSSFSIVMLLVLWRFAVIVRQNIRLSRERTRTNSN